MCTFKSHRRCIGLPIFLVLMCYIENTVPNNYANAAFLFSLKIQFCTNSNIQKDWSLLKKSMTIFVFNYASSQDKCLYFKPGLYEETLFNEHIWSWSLPVSVSHKRLKGYTILPHGNVLETSGLCSFHDWQCCL